MESAALVLLVVLVAVSFWRPLRRVRRALGFAHLLASGYLFLGLGVIGGMAAGASGASPVIDDLGPIIAFAAGWLGFAAGGRFEWSVLSTVPRLAFWRALAPAAVAAAAVGAVSAAALHLAGAPLPQMVGGALCLAAAGASAGPTLAAVLRTRRPGRSRDAAAMLRMIEFSAGLADGLVVVLAVLAFAAFRSGVEASPVSVILALSVGGGAVLGATLWLFLGGRGSEDERLLLGLGMLAMVAGLAGWLEVAPAAVGAVAGAALANLPGERAASLVAAVRRVERPVLIILMVVAGMYLVGGMSWYLVVLVVAMTALRLAARLVAAGPPRRALEGAPTLATPRGWTLGLTPQGILGLVVALSFFRVWQDDIARTVLAAVAIGGVINELIGLPLLLRAFRRLPDSGRRSP